MVLWVFLGIVAVLVVVALAALGITEPERRQGRELPIAKVDFAKVADGTYAGSYAGGMYGWRQNTVDVTVSGGRVTTIVVESAKFPSPQVTDPLYAEVVKAQSLQVDTISGATITSKAFLKSVEDALLHGAAAPKK
jgi:uncharacterized protein with FMN-binding domain